MNQPTAIVCGTAASLLANSALAQQSFRNLSAAQPSPGVTLFRQTFEVTHYDDDPTGLDRDVIDYRLNTQLAFGLSKDVALMAQFPVIYRDQDSDVPGQSHSDFGQGDLHAMIKWRIWQSDTGPIDTMRLSLLAGLDIPTSESPFDNDGWDPMLGAVFTSIQGRHGTNAAVRYKLNTHDRGRFTHVTPGDSIEDILYLDLAYLYRIDPPAFTAESHGAWYAMAELNGTYETNGDIEFLLAPGIMYEARDWVIEASVQLPVYEDVDNRPRIDWSVGVGFRLLF